MINFLKKIDIKTIIILGLLIVIFLLHKCSTDVSNDGKTVKIGNRTYNVIKHKIDTVFVPVKQVVYKKGEDINHEKIVYVVTPKEIDTNKVVEDYYSQVVYKDTLKLKDSLGYVSVTDTISNNLILYRKWESHINKITFKEETILSETPRFQFFVGGFTGYNSKLKSIYLGPTLMMINKKQNAINLGVGVGTGKEILFQGGIYKKIK